MGENIVFTSENILKYDHQSVWKVNEEKDTGIHVSYSLSFVRKLKERKREKSI